MKKIKKIVSNKNSFTEIKKKNIICLIDKDNEVAFIYGEVSKTFYFIHKKWQYLKRYFQLEFAK